MSEFLEKAASIPHLVSMVKDRREQILAALVGAGLATAYQMHHNRPRNGGLSSQQESSRSTLDALDKGEAALRASGQSPGYPHKLRRTMARASSDLSDVFAEHPVRGALTVGVPIGSSAGLTALRLMKSMGG